jgi:hypothetical protein
MLNETTLNVKNGRAFETGLKLKTDSREFYAPFRLMFMSDVCRQAKEANL